MIGVGLGLLWGFFLGVEVEMGFGTAALGPDWLNEFDKFGIGMFEFEVVEVSEEESKKLELEFGRPQARQYQEMFFILSMF